VSSAFPWIARRVHIAISHKVFSAVVLATTTRACLVRRKQLRRASTDRSGRLANQNFTRGRAGLPEQRRWLTIVPNQDHRAGDAPEPATAATSILVSAGLRIPGHFASNSSVRSCPVWKRNRTPHSARRAATGSTVPVLRGTSSNAVPSALRVHPRQSDRDRAPLPLLRLTRSPDRTR
jgi:hypothetical protein